MNFISVFIGTSPVNYPTLHCYGVSTKRVLKKLVNPFSKKFYNAKFSNIAKYIGNRYEVC
jgi:hypothetical protein